MGRALGKHRDSLSIIGTLRPYPALIYPPSNTDVLTVPKMRQLR